MTTEVKHGRDPIFEHQTSGGAFSLTLVGHYTTTPDTTAGGVTEHKYESDREGKRRAELLGMRTIFHEWWIEQWVARAGHPEEALLYLFGPFLSFLRPPS
jgi:hypothetical protein